eukprot:comp19729_c0_seq1/m.37987 comp19729_c0_seq1/g.37987  ORF comp19729_c0_seq1/g.37987 comp19729_c0_seq1/m.37987 type:complete len:358 (-) comp19729_c0_seq1:13-1086(-)
MVVQERNALGCHCKIESPGMLCHGRNQILDAPCLLAQIAERNFLGRGKVVRGRLELHQAVDGRVHPGVCFVERGHKIVAMNRVALKQRNVVPRRRCALRRLAHGPEPVVDCAVVCLGICLVRRNDAAELLHCGKKRRTRRRAQIEVDRAVSAGQRRLPVLHLALHDDNHVAEGARKIVLVDKERQRVVHREQKHRNMANNPLVVVQLVLVVVLEPEELGLELCRVQVEPLHGRELSANLECGHDCGAQGCFECHCDRHVLGHRDVVHGELEHLVRQLELLDFAREIVEIKVGLGLVAAVVGDHKDMECNALRVIGELARRRGDEVAQGARDDRAHLREIRVDGELFAVDGDFLVAQD